MLETQFKIKAIKYLRKIPNAWFYKANDRTTAGVPDIIMCVDGFFIAIELKSPTGKTSKIQDYTLERIRKAGGACGVARTIEEVLCILQQKSQVKSEKK
jgi:Holliday junction resolvase